MAGSRHARAGGLDQNFYGDHSTCLGNPTGRARDVKDQSILCRTRHDHSHRLDLTGVHLDVHSAGGDPDKVARPSLAPNGQPRA